MISFESERRRQDEIRVSCGLVSVEIDRHHEVERGKRGVERRAVRSARDGVSRHRDETAYLLRAGRDNLLGEGCDGQLSAELRQAAHPRMKAGKASPHSEARGQGREVDGGRGEHHSARPV